jgi:hypothetical protein
MISDEIYSRQVRTHRRWACGRCSTHLSRRCRRRFGLIFVVVTMLILSITVTSVMSMAGNNQSSRGMQGQVWTGCRPVAPSESAGDGVQFEIWSRKRSTLHSFG